MNEAKHYMVIHDKASQKIARTQTKKIKQDLTISW